MNGKEFLQTAYDIAVELFPERILAHPINLSDSEIETVITVLESRTGYVLKPEFQPSSQ